MHLDRLYTSMPEISLLRPVDEVETKVRVSRIVESQESCFQMMNFVKIIESKRGSNYK